MSANGDGGRPGLPEGWAWRALADIGTWVGGGTPSKERGEFWEHGTIPWVSPKDMKSWRLDSTQDAISEAGVEGSSAKVFAANSVAVVVRSGILEHTLPVALVPFKATANQDMRVATPNEEIDAEWLMYVLQAEAETIRRACRKDGTTVASVDVPKLMAWTLRVPPAKEQRRIVERIDERLSAIDGAARPLAAAEACGHALRLATLEGCLDPSWPRKTLKETVLSLRNGIFVSRPAAEPPGIPIFRISAVRPMRLRLDDVRYAPTDTDKTDNYFVRAGDLLFTRYSGNPDFVGACARVPDLPAPTLHPDKLIRVVVDREVLDPSFAELACSTGQTLSEIRARRKTTSGQVGISGSDLKGLTLPVPSLKVQREAVSRAHASLDAVEGLSEQVRQVQAQSERLRRSVLIDALRGSD